MLLPAFLLVLAGPAIAHEGVGCVVAEQFPRLEARVEPVDAAAELRVRFRPVEGKHWYSVRMKDEGGVFVGLLPRPKKSMKGFVYYLEATAPDASTARTEDYSPVVQHGAAACASGKVAGSLASGTVLLESPAGAPAVPVGFSAAGVTAAAAVAGGAAVAGAGAAAASGGGGVSTALLVGGGLVVAGGAAAAVVVATGGSLEIELRGYVYEADCTCAQNSPPPYAYRTGNPIAGATVSIPVNNASASTDARGYYELRTTGTSEDSFVVTVTAPGCSSSTYQDGTGTGAPPIHITLTCGNNNNRPCAGLCGQ